MTDEFLLKLQRRIPFATLLLAQFEQVKLNLIP